MVALHGEDLATAVRRGRLENQLIADVAARHQYIRLPDPTPPFQVIYIGYDKNPHCLCPLLRTVICVRHRQNIPVDIRV